MAVIKKVLADPEVMPKYVSRTRGLIFVVLILLMRQQIRRENEDAIPLSHASPSTSTPKSDLHCAQCKLDPSVAYEKMETIYTHAELNQHLKSNFHTGREQVLRLRCFSIDKDDNGQCRCPCCGDDSDEMHKQEAFISHMESDHRTVMEL